jgi:hypothetical protein
MNMKYKTSLVTLLLSLTLAACNFSLSEEITPPPGAEVVAANTTAPSTPTVTQIPPTQTSSQESVTTEVSATQETGTITGTPATIVTISGKVTIGNGDSIPAGLTATLYGIQDQQETLVLDQPLDSEGTYTFQTSELNTGMSFIILVKYGGVSFLSQGGTFDGTISSFDQPVTIYESTTDFSGLSLDQLHITASTTTAGELSFDEIYVLTNTGNSAVTIETDGTSLPFADLPEGALLTTINLASGSANLLMADTGFAMLPGTQQYAFVVSFTVPYTGALELSQSLPLPPQSVTVILPMGVNAAGSGLEDQGTQDFQGSVYQVYSGGPFADGASLDLTLSGGGDTSTSGTTSQGTSSTLVIGLAALGVLFVGLGVLLFLRDRKRSQLEEEESEELPENEKENEESSRLADEIIQLDDAFKAGKVPPKIYESKRAKLKAKLKELL